MPQPQEPLEPQPLQAEDVLPWIEVAQTARLNFDVLERLTPTRDGPFILPNPEGALSNMAWWCHGFLEAAADHLILWADYAAPLKFDPETAIVHTLRPAFTLARAAIEAAAQAIWVLSPDEPKECARRYIMLATWDVAEQAKAGATEEARVRLRSNRDEIFSALGVKGGTFRAPRYLDMIRDAAEYLDESDSRVAADRLERIWRTAAAAAHGKQWPEFELHDRVEIEPGVYVSTPKVESITEVLEAASKLLGAGVVLFAMRSDREDEYDRLWVEAVARLTARVATQ